MQEIRLQATSLDKTVQLVQDMIRAACVNDGSDQSGQEIRSANVLVDFFADCGAQIDIIESLPGRASVVARVKGTDPSAPKLALLGHIDVVPAERRAWQRDPFAGELVDDEIWGRGAVDMLFLTASFASVLRDTALAADKPRGDLIFIAAADEEAGGERGLKYLLHNHSELVAATEVLGESGGMRFGNHVAVEIGEKGSAGRRLTFHGTPGHASIPYAASGAIDVLQRGLELLAAAKPPIILDETWQAFVKARVADAALTEKLCEIDTVDSALGELGAIAGYAHAVSRTTVAVTKAHAGQAHNVIPASAQLTLDIRTLPGVDDDDVDALLHEALRPLAGKYELKRLLGWSATKSVQDAELFSVIADVVKEQVGAPVLPLIAAGGSDCRFYRELGVPAYGFALMSESWTYEKYRSRVHTHNERIDVESIAQTVTALRSIVARRIF